MYEAYLRQLLAPLGVYDLGSGSINGAELYAIGLALDQTGWRLEAVERESITATAEDEGLSRREALFARRPAAVTLEERRDAIAALLQIDGDSLTPSAIDRAIQGCGIRAKALEMDTGHLRVIFPGVGGVPAEFEQIKKIILDILPCHLEVEFYFRYLTWEECERAGYIWAEVEEHTWESFQLAVPPEE
ncbi:hypothetical protein [uncultured Oscillibacter sp.]|uniref:hypothetical protein n=1 Tax=uncultured Oscillibacter sp. TaxID=876091 RepID=UPI0025D551A0|nr:hypothetical protein [uncultured Oscillibacter sp.]